MILYYPVYPGPESFYFIMGDFRKQIFKKFHHRILSPSFIFEKLQTHAIQQRNITVIKFTEILCFTGLHIMLQ